MPPADAVWLQPLADATLSYVCTQAELRAALHSCLSVPVVVKNDHVVRACAVIPMGQKRSKGSHGHLQGVPFHACHETCLSDSCLQCTVYSGMCSNIAVPVSVMRADAVGVVMLGKPASVCFRTCKDS